MPLNKKTFKQTLFCTSIILLSITEYTLHSYEYYTTDVCEEHEWMAFEEEWDGKLKSSTILKAKYKMKGVQSNIQNIRNKTKLKKNPYLQLSARIELLERVDSLLAMDHGSKTISLLQKQNYSSH